MLCKMPLDPGTILLEWSIKQDDKGKGMSKFHQKSFSQMHFLIENISKIRQQINMKQKNKKYSEVFACDI